jgi:hypothetical protein
MINHGRRKRGPYPKTGYTNLYRLLHYIVAPLQHIVLALRWFSFRHWLLAQHLGLGDEHPDEVDQADSE